MYQFFLLLLQFGRDPYKRPGGAVPYASPRAMCFRLTGKTREALQVTGGIKARYFCRSRSVPFQGPRGQTHTHKPRRGERGRRAHRHTHTGSTEASRSRGSTGLSSLARSPLTQWQEATVTFWGKFCGFEPFKYHYILYTTTRHRT